MSGSFVSAAEPSSQRSLFCVVSDKITDKVTDVFNAHPPLRILWGVFLGAVVIVLAVGLTALFFTHPLVAIAVVAVGLLSLDLYSRYKTGKGVL